MSSYQAINNIFNTTAIYPPVYFYNCLAPQVDSQTANDFISSKFRTGSTFTKSLSLQKAFKIAKNLIKYAPLAMLLPWNKKKVLTESERLQLQKNLELLQKLKQDLDAKKTKRAFTFSKKHLKLSSSNYTHWSTAHSREQERKWAIALIEKYHAAEAMLTKAVAMILLILHENKKNSTQMSFVTNSIVRLQKNIPELTNKHLEKALRKEEIKTERKLRKRS